MTTGSSALVLFSGGQDSTVCLAWALERYEHVETVGFDYGQRHRCELQQRPHVRNALTKINPAWAAKLGPDHMLDLATLGAISATAMTRDVEITTLAGGLPNTFVPGRNLLFLTFAAALGYRRGVTTLIGGMCETDFSGYPDCRNETIQALANAISLGMDQRIIIETPLMWTNKAATWSLAHELGGQPLINIVIDDTHTCYLGERVIRHEWGYGCGTCPACVLRKRGYEQWQTSLAAAVKS